MADTPPTAHVPPPDVWRKVGETYSTYVDAQIQEELGLDDEDDDGDNKTDSAPSNTVGRSKSRVMFRRNGRSALRVLYEGAHRVLRKKFVDCERLAWLNTRINMLNYDVFEGIPCALMNIEQTIVISHKEKAQADFWEEHEAKRKAFLDAYGRRDTDPATEPYHTQKRKKTVDDERFTEYVYLYTMILDAANTCERWYRRAVDHDNIFTRDDGVLADLAVAFDAVLNQFCDLYDIFYQSETTGAFPTWYTYVEQVIGETRNYSVSTDVDRKKAASYLHLPEVRKQEENQRQDPAQVAADLERMRVKRRDNALRNTLHPGDRLPHILPSSS